MKPNESVSITFEHLFGSVPENISLEQLEKFLESVVSETFKDEKYSPNELVRVVQDGKIQWMTAGEVESVLQEEDETSALKRSVQHALKANFKVLAQELKVLYILAQQTLKHYREKFLIPFEEIDRISPQITRAGRQTVYHLDQLWEVEQRIKEVRRKNKILSEFESKMARFLDCQKKGVKEEAATLAKELAGMKNKYVRISKGLMSDINQSKRVRLDLQQQKKMVLSLHKYIVIQREGVLESALQDMQKSVENMKYVLKKGMEEEQKKHYQESLSERENAISTSKDELVVVKKENKYLDKKEKETEKVIEGMEHYIKTGSHQADESEAPSQERPKEAEKSQEQPSDSAGETDESLSKKRHMFSVERRNLRDN